MADSYFVGDIAQRLEKMGYDPLKVFEALPDLLFVVSLVSKYRQYPDMIDTILDVAAAIDKQIQSEGENG